MLRCFRTVVYLFASLGPIGGVLAEVPQNAPPEKDTLQAVLDRIHNHAAGDGWQRADWKDDAVDAYLEKLVAQVAAATGNGQLKPPVKLTDVRPLDPNQPRRFPEENVLIVGRDIKLTRPFRRSIVLADGTVEVQSQFDESVIVARHAIFSRVVTHSCVFVAGSHFAAEFDGNHANAQEGSLIVARNFIHMSSTHGSLLAAGGRIFVDISRNTTFLNSLVQGNITIASQTVRVPGLSLQPPAMHPLAERITSQSLIAVVYHGRLLKPGGLVFQLDGRRHVANLDEAIVDDSGNPVEPLLGWRLAFIASEIAVFRNGDAEVMVPIKGK